MELQLDEREASLILKVLNNRLGELRREVRHTRDSEAREYLKHKERLLTRVIDRFGEIDEKAHMRGFIVD
jgi:hypothetical protein